MDKFLPPDLLELFQPREPLTYWAPASELPWERWRLGPVGVADCMHLFENDARRTPPKTERNLNERENSREDLTEADENVNSGENSSGEDSEKEEMDINSYVRSTENTAENRVETEEIQNPKSRNGNDLKEVEPNTKNNSERIFGDRKETEENNTISERCRIMKDITVNNDTESRCKEDVATEVETEEINSEKNKRRTDLGEMEPVKKKINLVRRMSTEDISEEENKSKLRNNIDLHSEVTHRSVKRNY